MHGKTPAMASFLCEKITIANYNSLALKGLAVSDVNCPYLFNNQ